MDEEKVNPFVENISFQDVLLNYSVIRTGQAQTFAKLTMRRCID